MSRLVVPGCSKYNTGAIVRACGVRARTRRSVANPARETAADTARNADAGNIASVCGGLVSTRTSAASPAKEIAADTARNAADHSKWLNFRQQSSASLGGALCSE
jgi:hypothetical protein